MKTTMNKPLPHLKAKRLRVQQLIRKFLNQARNHYYERYQQKYLNDEFILELTRLDNDFSAISKELEALSFDELDYIEGLHVEKMKKMGMSVYNTTQLPNLNELIQEVEQRPLRKILHYSWLYGDEFARRALDDYFDNMNEIRFDLGNADPEGKTTFENDRIVYHLSKKYETAGEPKDFMKAAVVLTHELHHTGNKATEKEEEAHAAVAAMRALKSLINNDDYTVEQDENIKAQWDYYRGFGEEKFGDLVQELSNTRHREMIDDFKVKFLEEAIEKWARKKDTVTAAQIASVLNLDSPGSNQEYVKSKRIPGSYTDLIRNYKNYLILRIKKGSSRDITSLRLKSDGTYGPLDEMISKKAHDLVMEEYDVSFRYYLTGHGKYWIEGSYGYKDFKKQNKETGETSADKMRTGLLDTSEPCCHICNKKFNKAEIEGNRVTLDHFPPEIIHNHGGKNLRIRYYPSCQSCSKEQAKVAQNYDTLMGKLLSARNNADGTQKRNGSWAVNFKDEWFWEVK